MLSKTASKKLITGEEEAPLDIRKSKPGELFYRTGQVQARYCIKVQEVTHCGPVVATRYYAIADPLLNALAWAPDITVFHDVVSESGERFAYPVLASHDNLAPEGWQQCEKEALAEPLSTGLFIEHGEEHGSYEYGHWVTDDFMPENYSDFPELLDAALRRDLVDSLDHPVARCVCQFMRAPSGEITTMEWTHVG